MKERGSVGIKSNLSEVVGLGSHRDQSKCAYLIEEAGV